MNQCKYSMVMQGGHLDETLLLVKRSTAELVNLVGLYCMVSVTLSGFDVPVPEDEAAGD